MYILRIRILQDYVVDIQWIIAQDFLTKQFWQKYTKHTSKDIYVINEGNIKWMCAWVLIWLIYKRNPMGLFKNRIYKAKNVKSELHNCYRNIIWELLILCAFFKHDKYSLKLPMASKGRVSIVICSNEIILTIWDCITHTLCSSEWIFG